MATVDRSLEYPRDHRHHPQSEIEWWYLFAFLGERYTVMACVWRYRGRAWPQDGLMATYAVTEIDAREHLQATILDEPMFRSSREELAATVRRGRDPLLEGLLDVTSSGIPAPFRLTPSARCRSTKARPIQTGIGPLQLRHEAATETLHLRIRDGALRLDLAADMSSPSFPMGGTGCFEIEGLQMWGYTHPQAPLTGALRMPGRTLEAVAGKAWFDHQWGDWSFANPVGRHYHPEWHYFGVLLDDGRSLNLYRPFRQGARGREEVSHADLKAVLSEADGSVRILEGAQVRCRDHIESLRTCNLYEYGWSVEFADLPGRLELVPFHPDHEVLVPTQKLGILELGCHVTGHIQGQTCSGWGFVEAFGDMIDLNEFFWGQRKTNLAQQLERFMPRGFDPEWLQRVSGAEAPLAVDPRTIERGLIEPIWSMMDRGGKGWRSTWLATCCHALGYERSDDKVREFLPVIEMLHTGSLVIDDIQDRSRLRRGKPTLHLEIGTDLAINVGNFLYFLPLLLVQEARWLNDGQRAWIYDTVIAALRMGHVGQGIDLMSTKSRYDIAAKARDLERSRRELLEQYRLKSGSQTEAIARIAGIVAEAPEPLVAAVAYYSRIFGIVFQIADDLIDLEEGREKLGKDPGEDLRNGKLNMVLLHALAAAPERQREALIDAMLHGDGTLLPLVREVVRDTGAAERCIDEAEAMMEDAWQKLECLPPSDAKVVMRCVPKWLLHQRRESLAAQLQT